MRSDPRHLRHEGGFVLAVTLWLLAAMAIAVALMTLWANDQVRAAATERDRVDDEASMLTARETLLYIASTRESTRGGLSPQGLGDAERAVRKLDEFGGFRNDPRGDEIRLDGRTYLARGDVYFALQDEAGLFPLVLPSAGALDRFLAIAGGAEGQVPALRDAYLDYVDGDDLEHLEGMEAKGYARAGLAGPANRYLLAPPEVWSVAGWGALPVGAREFISSTISPYYSGPINMNAVPARLLPLWLKGCSAACDTLVQQRDRAVFTDSVDLEARVGVQLPGDDATDYRYAPSDTFSITLWGRSGSGRRMHVRLTPLADKTGPWLVLSAYPVSRPSDDAPAQAPQSNLLADTPSGGRTNGAAPARRAAGRDRVGRASLATALPQAGVSGAERAPAR
jgi:type II secretory pathway component PulK